MTVNIGPVSPQEAVDAFWEIFNRLPRPAKANLMDEGSRVLGFFRETHRVKPSDADRPRR